MNVQLYDGPFQLDIPLELCLDVTWLLGPLLWFMALPYAGFKPQVYLHLSSPSLY